MYNKELKMTGQSISFVIQMQAAEGVIPLLALRTFEALLNLDELAGSLADEGLTDVKLVKALTTNIGTFADSNGVDPATLERILVALQLSTQPKNAAHRDLLLNFAQRAAASAIRPLLEKDETLFDAAGHDIVAFVTTNPPRALPDAGCDFPGISVNWTVEDVRALPAAQGLTDADCQAVLELAKHNYDPIQGITWGVIDACIDEYKSRIAAVERASEHAASRIE
jgi:hypothetical protein